MDSYGRRVGWRITDGSPQIVAPTMNSVGGISEHEINKEKGEASKESGRRTESANQDKSQKV